MKKDFLDQEIFQYALTHGIINENELSRSVEDMKRKQIISSHPYSIWQNEAGLWCTHIRDINGKKKIRRRKTKEELLDFIVHHYRELEEKIYIKDLFEEWSEKNLGMVRYQNNLMISIVVNSNVFLLRIKRSVRSR